MLGIEERGMLLYHLYEIIPRDAVSVSIDKLKRISKWVRSPLNSVLSINIASIEDRAELSGIVGVIRTLAVQRYST